MRALSFAVLLSSAAALLASGCQFGAYFIRDTLEPVQALEVRMDPHERRSCLVVFLPGVLDTPDTYREQGFFEDATRASRRCDLVAVDAHFNYYRSGTVRERVGEDILRLAEARGYDELWLVGISMGGLGALMLAEEQAERIRGIVLLAPFMGDRPTLSRIEEAGGLAAWDAPDDPDRYDESEIYDVVWAWLQGYAAHPERMPELYVGVGTEDSLRPGVGLLAEVLPEDRAMTAPGAHKWVTWRILWRRLLRQPPWDPSNGTRF